MWISDQCETHADNVQCTRCLAHIINLATQALISTHRKSKHFNPANPDDDLPCDCGFDRDKVGLVHLALPALEVLHPAWTKQADRPKYCNFVLALNAGLEKIEEYYDRMADSDAYTFTMC